MATATKQGPKTDDHVRIGDRPGVHRSDPVAGGTLCGYRTGRVVRTEDPVTCEYCVVLKPMGAVREGVKAMRAGMKNAGLEERDGKVVPLRSTPSASDAEDGPSSPSKGTTGTRRRSGATSQSSPTSADAESSKPNRRAGK